MGLFSRRDRDDDDPYAVQDAIDRGKREGRAILDAQLAHGKEKNRNGSTTAGGASSGPSCPAANTPRRGKRG